MIDINIFQDRAADVPGGIVDGYPRSRHIHDDEVMCLPSDIGTVPLQNTPIRILQNETGYFRFGSDDENCVPKSDRAVNNRPEKITGLDSDVFIDDDVFFEIKTVIDLDEIPGAARGHGGLDRKKIMGNIEDFRMKEGRLEYQENKYPSFVSQHLFQITPAGRGKITGKGVRFNSIPRSLKKRYSLCGKKPAFPGST